MARIGGSILTLDKRRLTTRLDALWARIIKTRANHRCERCGGRGQLNAAHIYSRRWKSIRWNRENGLALDAGCHFWAHTNPVAFLELAERLRGESTLLYLRSMMGTKVDLQRTELQLKATAREYGVKP